MSDDAVGSSSAERGLSNSPQAVASFDEEHAGFVRKVQGFLHQYPTSIPLIVLLCGVVIFAFVAPGKFLSPLNLSVVLQQVTIVAILGMAQTLVILTAGIDLSVGLIMILCSVVMGRTAVVYGVPVFIAFPLGLLVGLACGCLNGLIVTRLRLPPFIVTLGTWSIFGALNTWYSNSETIRSQDMQAAAPFLLWLGKLFKPYDIVAAFGLDMPFLKGWVITYGSVLMIVLAIILSYVLSRTAFGRHVYATGDDPDAARLSGINTDRTLVAVYALAGLICAIGAWALIGRIGGVSPQAGQTANLDSITAVVIGGTSLFGGRGSIIGTLFGALIVGVFRNGLALSGLALLWQDFAVGVLIIVGGDDRSVDQEDFRMSDNDIILQAKGLHKRYGRVVALNNADFELRRNEILAVIGDNGAGKSTLIKAISGAVIPDEGEIALEGKPVHFKSPMDARDAGIETVYQNLALSPALSIADNMFLGREIRKKRLPGQMAAHARPLGHGQGRARKTLRTRPADHPEHRPGGGDTVRRPAAGRGGGARRGVRLEGHHHGRTYRCARGEGVAPRVGTYPRREAARHAYRVDLAQHAARLRGRRPHSHPPARPSSDCHRSEGIYDVGCGGLHDGRQTAARGCGCRLTYRPLRQ